MTGQITVCHRVVSENELPASEPVRNTSAALPVTRKIAVFDEEEITGSKIGGRFEICVAIAVPKHLHALLEISKIERAMIYYAPDAAYHDRSGSRLSDVEVIYANGCGSSTDNQRPIVAVLAVLGLTLNCKSRDPQVSADRRKIQWYCGIRATSLGHIINNSGHALTGTRENNILGNVNLGSPSECSGRKRNRIAVVRLGVMDRLHIRRRPIRIISRGLCGKPSGHHQEESYCDRVQ